MLSRLSIQNYALIDDLQVSFSEGFTTITGETGAGKSILLESLSLVLGKRADRTALRDQDRKCVVEAEFSLDRYPDLKAYFREQDLDYETNTILRREIKPSGKSRAFVNDSPVTLDVLSALGKRLVDVHSQHQTLELTEHDFQLHVVDALADNTSLLGRYRDQRGEFLGALKRLDELKTRRDTAFREQDYNEFLLDELDKANLRAGMQEELEEQYAMLSNAEQIMETLGGAVRLCHQEEYGLLSLQGRLRQLSGRLAGYGPAFKGLHERIQSLFIEADDITQELEQLLESQEADPAQMEAVGNQLQVLYNLQKKHGAAAVSDLIEVRESLREKVERTVDLDQAIASMEDQVEALQNTLDDLAGQLHQKRVETLPVFTSQLERQLSALGMPNASFKWRLTPQEVFGPAGRDSLELLFTANKGGQHGLLKKTASGGELSRIMLTIKAILASYEPLPTMMFDEIDTGVSGDISTRMAEIMQRMSGHMQIFAITHLPQVASRGHQQFKVYKEDRDGRTYTQMKPLGREERLQELAQMLGGGGTSDTALTHARELLN
ncbi:MAG: DNA repair protein RecN [Bacteroidetes bacterium]|nr:MAG: DNA repair protein RecN [Bacteroidota bacterium]